MGQGLAPSLQARPEGPVAGAKRLSQGLWVNQHDLGLQTTGFLSARTGMTARADARGSASGVCKMPASCLGPPFRCDPVVKGTA